MEVPWFAFSPSPVSIIFFSILTYLGARRLLKKNTYVKHAWLNALTDSFFIMAFVIISLDLFWVTASMIRFVWWFKDSFWQILFTILRDIAGISFTSFFITHHFKNGLLNMNRQTSFYMGINMLFLLVWFALASSPAWTDWTYAIRYDYPLQTIVGSFFISHLIGKLIVALCWNSIWD